MYFLNLYNHRYFISNKRIHLNVWFNINCQQSNSRRWMNHLRKFIPLFIRATEFTKTYWNQAVSQTIDEIWRQMQCSLSYCFAVALFSKRKEKVVVLISSVPSIGYTWYDKGCSFVCPNVTLLPNYDAYTHTHTDTHTCIHSFIFRKNFKCSSLNS